MILERRVLEREHVKRGWSKVLFSASEREVVRERNWLGMVLMMVMVVVVVVIVVTIVVGDWLTEDHIGPAGLLLVLWFAPCVGKGEI